MARITQTSTNYSSTSKSEYHTQSQSQSQSQHASETKKTLNEQLRDEILSGLLGYMTDDEIDAYAENLLRPQRDAQLEAAQQQYDTAKLLSEQEMADLAAQLSADIEEQRRSYAKSAADVQTAALARGMGRSSYMLDVLAGEGEKLARSVREMTQESERKREQAREKLALQAQQNAGTQGRINADYASQLAAKVQELKTQQRKEYNQNYLTAVSGSMGTSTSGSSSTTGSATSDTQGVTHTHGSSNSISKTYNK